MMTSNPTSIDIVVPVLNEEHGIQTMLGSVTSAFQALKTTYPDTIVKIIVVDGGSTDNTVSEISEMGMTVIKSPTPGRGNQIADGIRELSGEWILVLHGDVRLKPEALVQLAEAIDRQQSLGWGILGHDYDASGLRFWLTRLVNRLRFDKLGLGYGDQGQFVKRSILEEKGGFPEQPLMEDVELSLMLKDVPRKRLGEWLTASSRQWKTKGFWRYSIQNLSFARDYIRKRSEGQSAAELSQALYDRYYG